MNIETIYDRTVIRYLFAGFAGAATNVGLLYVLTSVLGIWYLLSGIASFSCSVVVSFLMQKRLTFNDRTGHRTNRKFIIFTIVAVANLGANTLLLYLLTDIAGLFYVVSQIIVSLVIAIWSFFIYRRFIFEVT